MKTCAVYHWWAYEKESDPFLNIRTPIIPSIATLRAVSDIPIVVLDISNKTHNWSYFPEKLNFKVFQIPFELENYGHLVKGNRHLSRLFDVHKWSLQSEYDEIIYVDSDVFFLRDILPLACDSTKFCWNLYNSGFYYYQPRTENNLTVIDIFSNYTKTAIYSEDFRKHTIKYVNYFNWYGVCDEMILGYMKDIHKELFTKIPIEEHTTAGTINMANKSFIKMFHGNGSMISDHFANTPHARGLLCLLIEEFYNNISKVLNESDIKTIYGERHFEQMKYKRVKLFNIINQLPIICGENGLYYFDKIKNIRMI